MTPVGRFRDVAEQSASVSASLRGGKTEIAPAIAGLH